MSAVRNVPCSWRCKWPALLVALLILGTAPLWGQVADPRSQGTISQGQPPVAVGVVPADEPVVDVRVVGLNAVKLTKVVSFIKTRPGRPFDRQLIDEDVRRLYKSRMFVNVKTYSQRVAGGQVVVFEVIERPILQKVVIEGNKKLTTKQLRKQIDIHSGDAMDPFAIEEARRKLESFYHEKGYSDARVTVLEGNRPEDRRARFLVDEGTKQRIWATHFVGNTIASEARLKTLIGSTPGWFYLFGGEVDNKKIEEDIDKITAYYRGLGFFRAKVGRELQFSEDKGWLTLTFIIDEGPRYMVHNRVVVGNTKFSAEELTKESKLKAGDFFNQAQMEADKTKMQDHYGSIGYLFAKVEPDPRFLEEPGQLDLVYNIQEGSRYRVGRVNVKIQGEYPHTRITTALNRMSLHPGDIVDTRQLRRSERLMQFSGLFANNPQNGEKPKIVFTPPDKELDAAASEAQKPDRDPSVRGQSPDDDPNGNGSGPAGDRYINVEYQGVLKPPSQWPSGGVDYLESGAAPQQLQPPASQPPPPQQGTWPRPTVVRGQFTAQDGQPAPAYGSDASGSYAPGYPPARFAQVSVPYSSSQPSYGSSSAGPSAGNGYSSTVPPSNYSSGDGSTNATSPGSGYPAYPNTPPSGQSYPNNQPLGGPYRQPGPYNSASAGVVAPNSTAAPNPQGGPAYQPTPNGTGASGAYGAAGSAQTPPQVVVPTTADNERVFPRPEDSQFARPLDLDVILKETQTGRLMFGVGINSDAGLVGNVTIDEQNFDITRVPQSWEDVTDGTAFRGAGQRFRIEAAPGTQVSRYMVTFQDPFFLDTDFTFGISGYYYERLYREWTEQRTGGRISLGYQINHDLSATLYSRAEAIDITNPAGDPTMINPVTGAAMPPYPLNQDAGPSGLFGFGATIAHDTRDSQFLPTEGHLASVTFEEDIGSFQFNSLDLDFKKFFLLYQRPDGSGRQVLTLGTHFGVKSDTTPIFERYYAGGFSSIRGFDFRGVSPVSPGDVHIGGDCEVLASAEYLYPITADDMLRGVIFCDTGTVEPTLNHWTDNYRVAPGFGLRIVVPAMGPAPIALDFAFPVAVNPGDRVLNFSFFVGFGR